MPTGSHSSASGLESIAGVPSRAGAEVGTPPAVAASGAWDVVEARPAPAAVHPPGQVPAAVHLPGRVVAPHLPGQGPAVEVRLLGRLAVARLLVRSLPGALAARLRCGTETATSRGKPAASSCDHASDNSRPSRSDLTQRAPARPSIAKSSKPARWRAPPPDHHRLGSVDSMANTAPENTHASSTVGETTQATCGRRAISRLSADDPAQGQSKVVRVIEHAQHPPVGRSLGVHQLYDGCGN
jgi:hypothetical protein